MSVTELIWKILSEYPEGVVGAMIGLFVIVWTAVLRLDLRTIINRRPPPVEADEDETP